MCKLFDQGFGRRLVALTHPPDRMDQYRGSEDYARYLHDELVPWLEETYPDPPLLAADPVLRARARGFAQHVVSEMHAIDVTSEDEDAVVAAVETACDHLNSFLDGCFAAAA